MRLILVATLRLRVRYIGVKVHASTVVMPQAAVKQRETLRFTRSGLRVLL